MDFTIEKNVTCENVGINSNHDLNSFISFTGNIQLGPIDNTNNTREVIIENIRKLINKSLNELEKNIFELL